MSTHFALEVELSQEAIFLQLITPTTPLLHILPRSKTLCVARVTGNINNIFHFLKDSLQPVPSPLKLTVHCSHESRQHDVATEIVICNNPLSTFSRWYMPARNVALKRISCKLIRDFRLAPIPAN